MKFDCNKCGECCRHVDLVLKYLPAHFAIICNPDENGVCQHLKNNLCDIYENRPNFCDLEWMAKNNASHLGMDEETYYKMTKDACKKLQAERRQKNEK